MTAQPTPERQTTFGDLKQALEAMPTKPQFVDYIGDPALYDNHMRAYFDMERHAWRRAFEWHVRLIERHAALSDKVGAHITDWIAIDREEEEGLALIREKFK